ncbi:hypothetical protein D3C75_1347100 [compost metagenome]
MRVASGDRCQLFRRDRQARFTWRVLHHHRNIDRFQDGENVFLNGLWIRAKEKRRQQHQRIGT